MSKRCRYCYELITYNINDDKDAKNSKNNDKINKRRAYKLHIQKHRCQCYFCLRDSKKRKYREYYVERCAICGVKISLDDSTAITWIRTENYPRTPYSFIEPYHSVERTNCNYKKGHLCEKDKDIVNSNFGRGCRSHCDNNSQANRIAYDLIQYFDITSYFINMPSFNTGPKNKKINGNNNIDRKIDKRLLISGDTIAYILGIILYPLKRLRFIEKYKESLLGDNEYLTEESLPKLEININSVIYLLRSPFLKPLTNDLEIMLNSSHGRICDKNKLEKLILCLSTNHLRYLEVLQVATSSSVGFDSSVVSVNFTLPIALLEIVLSYYDSVSIIIDILKKKKKKMRLKE